LSNTKAKVEKILDSLGCFVSLLWHHGKISLTIKDTLQTYITITQDVTKFEPILQAINQFIEKFTPVVHLEKKPNLVERTNEMSAEPHDFVSLLWINGMIKLTIEDGQWTYLTITQVATKFIPVLNALNQFIEKHSPKGNFNPWFGFIRR